MARHSRKFTIAPKMRANGGVFALRTPADMLAKLRHDYQRLKTNPVDSYAAWDFFVTAFHMNDWTQVRPRHSSEKKLLRVCAQIANGSKHFDLGRHSVKETEYQQGVFDPQVFDPNVFDVGRLLIHLEGDAATVLGDSLDAVTLARKVLDYWESKLPASHKAVATIRA